MLFYCYGTGLAWFKSSDLNHDLNQAIKVTKSDFFDFWKFLLLFVVHNCRDEEINVTKSDFFINIFLFVVQNFVLIMQ